MSGGVLCQARRPEFHRQKPHGGENRLPQAVFWAPHAYQHMFISPRRKKERNHLMKYHRNASFIRKGKHHISGIAPHFGHRYLRRIALERTVCPPPPTWTYTQEISRVLLPSKTWERIHTCQCGWEGAHRAHTDVYGQLMIYREGENQSTPGLSSDVWSNSDWSSLNIYVQAMLNELRKK